MSGNLKLKSTFVAKLEINIHYAKVVKFVNKYIKQEHVHDIRPISFLVSMMLFIEE